MSYISYVELTVSTPQYGKNENNSLAIQLFKTYSASKLTT